ncbi:CocE/NonD family hydrolase [Rhodococcus sp. NCIMB 12038]|uniref:CocE/NonD family hydrolase n=1 Tax=Rhodococcus sp. NCIMB 12038 TaxID=933800 RepID=UPI000B3CD6A2|nr:CocE/NonD family hydrolase [Rhodococcus sp. NCIMB 12038]OUS82231.1 hypothetical protein CA951_41260 [Rhodococcus sp. NCIMB 12038]
MTATDEGKMGSASEGLNVTFGVEMHTRDGVRLLSDVYLPVGDGPWPVVVQRNPYDRTDAGMGSMRIVDPAWLARQGFAVVIQDTRGRGGSDGKWKQFNEDVDDGYDCVEWAASQPWSTGSVGMYGSSGMGLTTYKAVASQPPHLKAAVAVVAPTQWTTRAPGGPFEVSFVTWYALKMAMDTVARLEDRAFATSAMDRIMARMGSIAETWDTLPLSSIDPLSDPTVTDGYWLDWVLAEPGVERPGATVSLSDKPEIGQTALLHIAGYRDQCAPEMFALAAAQKDSDKHRLIAGPWTHRGVYSGASGAREPLGTSSPGGPVGWGPVLAAWFDIHLRGGDGSGFPLGMSWIGGGGGVRCYVEGTDAWATAPSWPPASVVREWILTSNGTARSAGGDGRLVPASEVGLTSGSDHVSADPRDPFPTCGGGLGLPVQGPDAIQDQRAVDGREDVLVYTSEPLEIPMTIVGAQTLVLEFESSAVDADVYVTLVDVEPDGFALNVCDGALRTRYREGRQDSWLTPGVPVELSVELHDTAHTFRPGHRVRVMVAGGNYPRYSRNLHTKTVPELGDLAEAQVAEHVIHNGPGTSSRLVLNEAAAGSLTF